MNISDISLTILKSSFAKLNDVGTGAKYTFGEVVENCRDWHYTKDNAPSIMIQSSGVRLSKDDNDYFKYWDGLIFVDIDDISGNGLSVDDVEAKVDNVFKNASVYLGRQRSHSGNLHLFFYIPAKAHTKLEYYAFAALCYDYVKRLDFPEACIDTHNFNYSQVLKVSDNEIHLNPSFDIDRSKMIMSAYATDEEEWDYIKTKLKDRTLISSVINQTKTYESKPLVVSSDWKWEVPEIKLNDKAEIIWDHQARLELITTLAKFYNKETATELSVQVSLLNKKEDTTEDKIRKQFDDWWKSGNNEKYNASNRIIEELIKYGFDLYTTVDDDALRKPDKTYNLTKEQYLSDIRQQLIEDAGDAGITLIESPAGSGKTQFVLGMSCNVILTEPYTSIIKNKVEQDMRFTCLYGDVHLQEHEHPQYVCCTPDKLIAMDDEHIKDAKYVFVDESHLIISNSSFRLCTMGEFVKKINHIVSLGTKVILLTGTVSLETQLFPSSRYIKVNREDKYKKDIEFVYADNADAVMQKAYDIMAQDLLNGVKTMIYCNRGDDFVVPMMEAFCKLTNTKPRWTYFKRDKIDEEANSIILKDGSIDHIDILFSSLYMGEGMDIFYEGEVKIIFLSIESLQTVEQYAARLRRTDKNVTMILNRDVRTFVDKETRKRITKAKKTYNIAAQYQYLAVTPSRINDAESNINAAKALKETDQYDAFVMSMINMFPYINKDTLELDKEWLRIYELYKSAYAYFSQFGVIYSGLVNDYGWNTKFMKSVKATGIMKEANTLRGNTRKARKANEGKNFLDAIDKAYEGNIATLQITYKTKNKALELLRKMYDCGVMFESCKDLARSLVENGEVDWKEGEDIVRLLRYIWKDNVEKKIAGSYDNIIKKINEFTECGKCRRETYKRFIDSTAHELYDANGYQDEQTLEDCKDIVKKLVNVHCKSVRKDNSYYFTKRELGDIFDTMYYGDDIKV